MSDARDNDQEKLDALDLLMPLRERDKRFVWEYETEEGKTIRFEDVLLEGQKERVTLYTVFDPDITADAKDAFLAAFTEMSERQDLLMQDEEVRFLSFSARPTKALKALAVRKGIVDGLWAFRNPAKEIVTERVSGQKDAMRTLISKLDTNIIHMILAQAWGFYFGGREPGSAEGKASPLEEVVEDAGNALTSADGKPDKEPS